MKRWKTRSLFLILLCGILGTSMGCTAGFGVKPSPDATPSSQSSAAPSSAAGELRTVMDAARGPYQFISEDSNPDIQEVAGILLTQLMDEMKVPDENRTFTVVDYIMGPPKVEWDEDGKFWTVEVSVDVLYDGIMSPIGPQDAKAGNYNSIDIGLRRILQDGNTYKMELWVV